MGTAPSHVYCIDDPRLKVKMASERQEKDKYTHAEVGFEHPARGKDICGECAHFIRGSLGGWHVGGCEIVKDPIEPENWCNRFRADPDGGVDIHSSLHQSWVIDSILSPGVRLPRRSFLHE